MSLDTLELPAYNLDSEQNFSYLNYSIDMRINDTVKDNLRLKELLSQYVNNMSLEPPAYWTLIFMYSTLIIVGTVGNLFVVSAVVRKPSMRTARNMFILNLAISDLLLCLFTAPLTLSEVVSKHWPFVEWVILCKMITALQGISIFVSTITIIAIALDRYQVIIYPANESLKVTGAIIVIGLIWIISMVLVSPLYIYKRFYEYSFSELGLEKIAFCREEWPSNRWRSYYSAFSLIVQYIIPIIVVSTAYCRIYLKLKNRYMSAGLGLEAKKERDRRRKLQKTNSLLIAIAVVYGVSWLPLNIFNLFSDIYGKWTDQSTSLILFSICHMMGMSSASSNPLLYGWLNDNFRKEFKEILACSNISRSRMLNSTTNRKNSPDVTLNIRLETTKLTKLIKRTELDEGKEITEKTNQIVGPDSETTTLA